MWSAIAAVMVVGTVAAVLGALGAQRRRPFAVQVVLALAVTIALEAVLLDVLSLFRAVTRAGVLGAHAGLLAGALAIAWSRGWRPSALRRLARRARSAVQALGVPGVLLLPLAVLVASSAARFAPSNWDSMTYRLARVAHWIQQASVEPYPTHVVRQALLTPGAEYLLAVVQVVSGSDRLANFAQLGAWAALVLAAPSLARAAGAPRLLAPWAAVLVAGIPMAVLQASSTQNDLVAAVAALALACACLPFLHRRPGRWRLGDTVVLSTALAAAALVKATAVLAAAPLVAVVVARVCAGLVRGEGRREAAFAIAVALAIGTAVLGPEVVRRGGQDRARRAAAFSATYLYRGLEAMPDRFVNLARGVVRHVPSPAALVAAVGIPAREWCGPDEALCRRMSARAHEDYAGNPLHVGVVALAGAVALARRRRIPLRARASLALVAASWVVFHFALRDNAWISRLETPTFALTGLAVAAWAGVAGPALARARAATVAAALAVLAHGTTVAARNETRPPLVGDGIPELVGYYANREPSRAVHDVVLRAARELRCERIGLLIGEDDYDYPLTWRAMQQGAEVRHVFGEDPWPCLVFTGERRPPAPLAALRWAPTPLPFLYVNAGAAPAP